MWGKKNKIDSNTKNLIEKGLLRATDAFSNTIGEKVMLDQLLISGKKPGIKAGEQNGLSQHYLLATEIIGDFRGTSYFLLSDKAAFEFLKNSISQHKSIAHREEFVIEYLKEIDNIISAAVITDLSDKTQAQMYGDIPQLSVINSDEFKKMIPEKISGDVKLQGESIWAHARLSLSDQRDHLAHFMWHFDSLTFSNI